MKVCFNYFLAILLTLVISLPAATQDYPAPGNFDKAPYLVGPLNNPEIDGNGSNSTMSYVATVLPGNNSTSGNGRAPQGSRRFINTKYIITGPEMTASGFSGTVTSVGWRWNVPSPPAASAPVAQSITTTGNLRVYLKDTLGSALTFGGTFIDTNGVGYTKIIDGTITIPSGTSEINIDVPVGGPGTGPYTPTPGNGVLLIFVYKTTSTSLATPSGAPTCFCTNVGSGTKLLTYQSNTVGGATGSSSAFRPHTRFGEITYPDDMGVTAIVSNPPPPACLGTTEIFTATVRNFGSTTQAPGVPVVLRVDGIDVETKFTTTSLAEDATENVAFTGLVLLPGTHEIKSFTQLPGDQRPSNDMTTVFYTVLSSIAVYPYLETFTNPIGWTISGTANLWVLQQPLTNPAGKVPDTAAKCNFYGVSSGSSILKSPPLDFTGLSNPVVHFYTAYKTYIDEEDSLQVLISTDCGLTFSDVPVPYRKSNSSVPSLATRNPATALFTPDSASQWRHETINLAAYAGNPNVIIGFRGVSGFGNNLYLDNFIATNGDSYCASVVTTPGVYACNPLISFDFTTVGMRPGGYSLTEKIIGGNKTKSIEEIKASQYFFSYSPINPIVKTGNYITDNPTGGDLSVTQHTSSAPPSTASPEVAPNSTATTNDGSIYTPDNIHPNYWFTTTYTGEDKAGYPLYNVSIDASGFPFPDRIYIVKRADMTGSWECLSTTRSGSILTATGVNKFCDYALASSCPFPGIPTITITDTNSIPITCGGTISIPGHNGSYNFVVTASGEPGEVITLSESHVLTPPDCKLIEINPPLPITQVGPIVVNVTVTRTTGDACTGIMTFNVRDECLPYNDANCRVGFDNPLPVELASFTSVINGSDVTLNWSTSFEQNNSGFEIERSYQSGEWTKIGFEAGNGTSNNVNYYSFTDRNLRTGTYNYRLKQIDHNGNFAYFNLSNEVNIGVPLKYDLSQNYPNPFNPSTRINFALPEDGRVSLKIYDMSGKEVMTLVNEVKTAGYYSIDFNASSAAKGLSSGVYFYRLSTDKFTATKKMMLIK